MADLVKFGDNIVIDPKTVLNATLDGKTVSLIFRYENLKPVSVEFPTDAAAAAALNSIIV